jgi:16S rRNA (guanine527-N7)-methyltransferase
VQLRTRETLTGILEEARRQGFLGPGDVRRHIDHALGFVPLCPDGTDQALDLGSGAGVPGIVLALAGVGRHWVFLDANQRRAMFLGWAAGELDLANQVTVECRRAEVAGRGKWRGRIDLVVARGFGPPAVTAECGSPFLHPGGVLVVAEPPADQPGNPRTSEDRWPAEGLTTLGLIADCRADEPVAIRRFRQVDPCPTRYPRRTGIPRKRPLF